MKRKSVTHYFARILIVIFFSLIMILPSFSVRAAGSNAPVSKSKQSTLPRLKVSGNQILDEKNRRVILKGFCCGTSTRITTDWPTWYTDQTFKTIKSWGVNVFRITFKPEQYVQDPACADLLYKYIDMCIDNNLYVLVSWMGNKDYLNYSSQAVSFFDAMSKRYSNCNNVLYEVCNEPFNSQWSTIHDYAEAIIGVIRSNSPNSVIAVPVAYHILETDDHMESVIDNPIKQKNIIYTFHMYVGKSLKDSALESIDKLVNNNIPMLISEWGATDSNGRDGFYKEKSVKWINFLDSRKIGWINFNLSDVYWNNTPYNSSAVKMGQWNSSLNDEILSDSGYLIKHYFLGDLKTSSISGSIKEAKTDSFSSKLLSSVSNPALYAVVEDGFSAEDDFSSEADEEDESDASIMLMMDEKNSINSIVFAQEDFTPSNIVYSGDLVVPNGTQVVHAYYCSDDGGNTIYFVSPSGDISAPSSMESFFEGFTNLKSVDFTGLDTAETTSVKRMFYNCSSLEDIKWNDNMFGNASNWSETFASCNALRNLDLENVDMSNATNINLMFSWCNNLERLSLPFIDTGKLKSTVDVFYKCGADAKSLNIDVLSGNEELIEDLLKCSTAVNGTHFLACY